MSDFQEKAATGDAPRGFWRRPPVLLAAALLLSAALAPVAGLLLWPAVNSPPVKADILAGKADDDYFQYSYAQNEAAIELYERAARLDPKSARAWSGLSSALVQRAMRWPQGAGPNAPTFTKLEDALKAGFVDQPKAKSVLRRAERMARRAIDLAPGDASAHKALALALSARRDFEGALAGYKRSIALDRDNWGSMINVADVLELQGKRAEAVRYFELAYEAMSRVYGAQTARVRPWHSDLGIHIGDAYRARGELKQSAQWYRRVLEGAPMHPKATGRLAAVLHETGDERSARQLCEALKSRLGGAADCDS